MLIAKKFSHFSLLGGLLLSLAGIWLTHNAVLADTARGPAGVAVKDSSVNVISIWGGARETIALKSDGTVWLWGSNRRGECGDGTSGNNRTTPVLVLFLQKPPFLPLLLR
jgi:hypothetical protein